MMKFNDMLAELKQGVEEILVEKELVDILSKGKPLRVKVGFDPTAPDIHLGHTVLINKLRQFQELGHQIVIIVGDFTAIIGDPTGRNVTRKPLTTEEVLVNAQTYQEQIFKLLDPDRTEIHFNSRWIQKLGSQGLIKLAATYTVARMLEREDFHKRYKQNVPIAIHEFLYPLLQGYDSVEVAADIELGGTDQTFNLLVGRELQKHYGQKPQVVMILPLLEGLDGIQKMSKSLGNYIGVTDSFTEMFGKVMSISDTLMWRYYEVLNVVSKKEVDKLKNEAIQGRNPRDIKLQLAYKIVERFHSQSLADQALEEFIAQFQKGALPAQIEEIVVASEGPTIPLCILLKQSGLTSSTSEALRLIQAGAVKIEGNKVEDKGLLISIQSQRLLFQVGKRRYAYIIFRKSE